MNFSIKAQVIMKNIIKLICGTLFIAVLANIGDSYSSKRKVSIKKAQKESIPSLDAPTTQEKMGPLQDQVVEDVSADEPHPTDPKGQLAESTEPIVEGVDEKTPAEALDALHPKTGPVKGNLILLKHALEGAYKQSPLITAEYAVKAAQMDLSGAKRDWLPKASASISYTDTSSHSILSRGVTSAGTRSDSNADTRSGSAEGALILQQNLYSGGATMANIRAQEKALEAAIATHATTARDTLFSAIQTFIDLSTKLELFRVKKGSQKVLERQLEVARNRYEFGELTRYDVATTQAKLDKAKAEVITALAEAEISKATFIKTTGLTTDGPLEKPGYPENLLPESKSEAVQIALKISPTLKKQDAIAEAASAEADKTFGGLLPSFDVSATASRQLTDQWDKRSYYQGHGKTRREQLEAKATLSIPLDFRGSTQASIRQRKYTSAQKRLQAIYERRNIMEQVSQQWDALEAARAQIKQLESQVKASKIALDTVNEEFLSGSKTTLDVLTAEQELSNAQVELVKVEQNVILSAYKLLAILGKLTAPNLDLNVSIYDPQSDYDQMSFWGINIDHDQRINDQILSNKIMKNAEATNDF